VAIDSGDNGVCPANDQRGASRPVDGDGDTTATCDLGSYEADEVLPADTTTTLTSSLNPSTFGDTVTFTATVTAEGEIPTGTVTFVDTTTATTLGTVTLDGSGQASLAVNTLTVGSHNIVATYNGNPPLSPSSSEPLTQVVNAVPTFDTTTTLTSSLNPSNLGDPVTFTATVTPATAGPTPTGTVTFVDTTTATTLGTVTLDGSGQASLSTNALAVGSHDIVATYNGSATYNTSSSAPLTQVVNAVATVDTTTTLTSSLNPSNLGDPVTFTATVTPATAGPTPTGTVTFVDTTTATTLGTVTLDGSGQASLTTNVLTVGSHDIVATYGGSATYNASSSAPLTQVVNGTVQTDTPTPTDTPDPAATPTPTPTGNPTGTLTPAPEKCLVSLPVGSVQGRIVSTVFALYDPNPDATTNVAIPGGTSWWIIGTAPGYYRLWIACQANPVWVSAFLVTPNYDVVWGGAPLPDAGE
jgi:hypothetical protein